MIAKEAKVARILGNKTNLIALFIVSQGFNIRRSDDESAVVAHRWKKFANPLEKGSAPVDMHLHFKIEEDKDFIEFSANKIPGVTVKVPIADLKIEQYAGDNVNAQGFATALEALVIAGFDGAKKEADEFETYKALKAAGKLGDILKADEPATAPEAPAKGGKPGGK